MTRNRTWTLGLGTLLLTTLAYHFLIGAPRFETQVESDMRRYLDHYEMTAVRADLHSRPLTRTVMLSGPANTFQREEIVRRIEQRPGVGEARWNARKTGVPLLVEVLALALSGFALGAMFAYVFGIRRHSLRYDYF